jgi:hypothetical protein
MVSTDLWNPPERDMPRGRALQRREHLVHELTESSARLAAPLPSSHEKRTGRRWATLALVPALLLLGAAAYAIVTRHAEDVVNGIGCYAAASVTANTTVAQADGRNPVAICEGLWKQGAVVAGVTKAPPLIACVPAKGGAVWVFPGRSDTCQRLGLGMLPPGYPSAARDFVAMRDDLARQFDKEPCLSEASARLIARRVLDAHGFDDWQVREGTGANGSAFSSDRPCAGLSFDPGAKAVILVAETG